MKRAILLFIFLSVCFNVNSHSQDVSNIINRWQLTDTLIRDNKIDKESAVDSLRKYVPIAINYCHRMNLLFTKKEDWAFPMNGYTQTEYRSGGKDYRDSTFDYFQGAEYKGHPAHDIFIPDNDSNGIEDITGKPVDASAMASGLIISVYSRWKPDDIYRSGNYVKLFDPESKSIFYYSHLDSVLVKSGQIVKAGEKIGTVGRTGRKAFRGKTHLHIAFYKFFDGYPKPMDILSELLDAEKRESKSNK
jgi:peptidoglycan LD-endopeptidase LytH